MNILIMLVNDAKEENCNNAKYSGFFGTMTTGFTGAVKLVRKCLPKNISDDSVFLKSLDRYTFWGLLACGGMSLFLCGHCCYLLNKNRQLKVNLVENAGLAQNIVNDAIQLEIDDDIDRLVGQLNEDSFAFSFQAPRM